MTKQNPDDPVESVDSASLSSVMHLDDFLNSRESLGAGIESLSAFARVAKLRGSVKQEEAAWDSDYSAFMSEIPK